MRKFLVAVLAVLIASALPAGASHNRHDHSPNVEQVSSTLLRWPWWDGESDAAKGPMYASDLVFEKDVIIGAVAGGHGLAYHPGEIPETGLALFRLRDGGDQAFQIGRYRCLAFPDVSVWGDLAFQGVLESQMTSTRDQSLNPCDRDGLRILDISDPKKPAPVAFVDVPCGVGDHAVVPHGSALYLYDPSSCDEQTDNPFGAGVTSEMAVIRIDKTSPRRSRIVSIADISPMTGCSEIIAITEHDLAACAGDHRVVLIDISDRAGPKVIEGSLMTLDHRIRSLAFSWDGSYLVAGTDLRVASQVSFDIFNIEDRSNPVQVGQWSAPTSGEADIQPYSLSFVPMKDGRQIVVGAHASLGMWIVDITDPAKPRAIGHYNPFDESTVSADQPFGNSNTIAAYWYNGRFYASDFWRIRTFRVKGFNRRTVHFFRGRYNPQTQIANSLDR